MNPYCEYCKNRPDDTFNRSYHDTLYGFPIHDDNSLFERLVLEINQAGLSWITILKKADNFKKAYDNFDISKIACYGDEDRARLLADSGIIRNRLKVNAAIENAIRINGIQKENGSFEKWLDAQSMLIEGDFVLDQWARIFKKTFVFTGGEIVKEFLMSSGYISGAHDETCPIFHEISKLKPAWMR